MYLYKQNYMYNRLNLIVNNINYKLCYCKYYILKCFLSTSICMVITYYYTVVINIIPIYFIAICYQVSPYPWN